MGAWKMVKLQGVESAGATAQLRPHKTMKLNHGLDRECSFKGVFGVQRLFCWVLILQHLDSSNSLIKIPRLRLFTKN